MANDKYYFTNYTGRNIEDLLDGLNTYKNSIVLKDGSVHFNGVIYNDTNDISLIGTRGIVGMRAANGTENLGQFNIFNEGAGKAVQMFAKGSNGYYGIKVNENGMYYIYSNNGSQTTTNFNDIFVTIDTNQTISGTKTFNGNIILDLSDCVSYKNESFHFEDYDKQRDAFRLYHESAQLRATLTPILTETYDLGSSPFKWRDLYLSGSLKDGTNSVSVANIENNTNKVTSLSSSSTDIQYPSAKAVYNFVKDKSNLVETTWSALKSLKDNSQLIPGIFYRITDYTCTTTQENTSSAGHVFDIIVLALESNKLSEEAWAAHHSGDTYFADSKLEAWKLWYCLDNDINKFAWADNYGIVVDNIIYVRNSSGDDATQTYGYSWINNSSYRYTNTDNPTTETRAYSSQTGGTEYSISSIHQESGKGVIYRMIDEFNNDCPYDFKNILFTKVEKYTNAYTFNDIKDSENADASLNYEVSLESLACYNNTIKAYIRSQVQMHKMDKYYYQRLNFNVFYPNHALRIINNNFFDYNCHDNILSSHCYNNIFKYECYNNEIGDTNFNLIFELGCHDNILKTYCYHTKFGNNCSYNNLGSQAGSCTFESGASYNTLGSSSSNNIIAGSHNTIGTNCRSNIFKNSASYNVLGDYCFYNTFGNNCQYNTFGDSSSTIERCRHNIIDTGCSYLYIVGNGTASSSNQLQNIHIHSGVVGSSSENRRTITVDRGLEYSTDIYAHGSKEVVLDD